MTTNYYNNYKLNYKDKSDLRKETNILKSDSSLPYNNYEKLKIAEQYNKLYSNIYNENNANIKSNENIKIYNLSFHDLIKNAVPVYNTLLNNLSNFFSKENNDKSFNNLGLILTNNDNLLYIGILVLVISFLLWLIDITR